MKSILTLISMLISAVAFAENASVIPDLVLPGEKWVATHNSYICAAFEEPVAAPTVLADMQVKFETMTTDSTLDNALLRATFVENGVTCRYNAIILADNDAQDASLVQSIAFNVAGGGSAYKDCVAGKKVLDQALEHNDYLYYGHPHNLALMLPGLGAESVCGADKGLIGVNFVVTGKLPQPAQ